AAEGGAIHIVPGSGDTSRSSWVVSRPKEKPRDFVILGSLSPTSEWAILGIGIDIDIVAVLNTDGLGVLRVDIHIALHNEGQSLVVAVNIPEGAEQHGV